MVFLEERLLVFLALLRLNIKGHIGVKIFQKLESLEVTTFPSQCFVEDNYAKPYIAIGARV